MTRARSRRVIPVLLALPACSPSAAVETSQPEPATEPAPDSHASQPRYARLSGSVLLYAAPSPEAIHVELKPMAKAANERLVERLEVHPSGTWTRVRTLLPRETMALGYQANAGIAVLSLEGWIETRRLLELPAAPPGSRSSNQAAPEQPPVAPETANPALFEVRGGTLLRWPDGRVAGEAVEDHYFHTAPTSSRASETPEGDPAPRLLCHEHRSAPSLGFVDGWLCVSEEDLREAGSVDPRTAIALDRPTTSGAGDDQVGDDRLKGALDRDIIRRIVRANLSDVRDCYNVGLSKDPQLEGRVALNFVINKDGHVSSAVVTEDALDDPEVGRCIAAAMLRWRFPTPRGGGNVVVTYPFNLTPG